MTEAETVMETELVEGLEMVRMGAREYAAYALHGALASGRVAAPDTLVAEAVHLGCLLAAEMDRREV